MPKMEKVTSLTKRCIQKFGQRLGLDIRKVGEGHSSEHDLFPWVRDTQNIQTVIDIGANNGDFAAFLYRFFKPKATYVFEPLASCAEDLRSKASSIPNFYVFNLGLSDHTKREYLYENSYSPASSFLHVSEVSKLEFPQTSEETPKIVEVRPLDDLLDPKLLEKNILVKVDVQGFEDRVINGGKKVFSTAQCVLIEMSFAPMYDGQPLFEEIHSLLVNLGFRFSGFKNQISSSQSGQPLFGHCLYLKSKFPVRPTF